MNEIPERLITEENTRLWRPEAVVHVIRSGDLTDYRFSNPIPVYSADRLVGAATLDIRDGAIHATLSVDYSIPERLEAEIGRIWALPHVTVRHLFLMGEPGGLPGPVQVIAQIDGIQLRNDCTDPALPAIGEVYL